MSSDWDFLQAIEYFKTTKEFLTCPKSLKLLKDYNLTCKYNFWKCCINDEPDSVISQLLKEIDHENKITHDFLIKLMALDTKSDGERGITDYAIETSGDSKTLHLFHARFDSRYIFYFFKQTFFSISYTQLEKFLF